MARPQNLKRQRADDCSEEERPQKKPRSRRERGTLWNYPPGFYDNLSKVWLTRLALRELDRRNSIAPQSKPSVPTGEYSSDLARFARHGGPDLCHLRGYPEHSGAGTMGSQSSTSASSRRTKSTKETTLTTKKISAKDKGFEQHLIDHDIFPEGYEYPDGRSAPEPTDFDSIRKRISIPRASLSPSQFSESAFRDFKRKNLQVVSENDVMTKVIPILSGNADIHSQQNIMFTELLPITTEDASKPQPDFFDGAHIHELDKAIRDDDQIRPMIIPSKHRNVPVANNFFLEAKGPSGNAAVMQRQACYDGAYGTRAIHSVQNYGEEAPVYDGNARSFSSTYHNGQLQLYAHHAIAPAAPGGRPEYHMTQLGAYALTGSRETLARGAGAFRHTREIAKEFRDGCIGIANARARGEIPPAEQDNLPCPSAVHDSALSPNEYFDCQELPEPQDVHDDIPFPSFREDADDDLAASRTALPGYLYEDNHQDESQDSLSLGAADEQTSLVTSFTSSFRSGTGTSNSRVHSKRSRASNSPPTSHQKKSRGSERNKADREKSKGKASSPNKPDDNDWEWDTKMKAYKSWNKDRWEYWDEQRQARKYYDGKKWRWVNWRGMSSRFKAVLSADKFARQRHVLCFSTC